MFILIGTTYKLFEFKSLEIIIVVWINQKTGISHLLSVNSYRMRSKNF